MENENNKDRLNIVVVGHVDHGKSTIIGRLLVDTNSLPKGKLESVKKFCEKNSRPFEYAFLLDALKDEQSQGITIDIARIFFKTNKREYIIIDAPGHIEFLKNMVTGASHAEAAVLVIDANEGIQENSKRHGYLLSMIGIKNIVVVINKIDIINYDEGRFKFLKEEYNNFLSKLNILPYSYIPVCARDGDNIVFKSEKMKWYNGQTLLEVIDSFEKEIVDEKKPFRMPVQDIYKFTAHDDDRRIIAGTVESGVARIDDEVIFLPSGKKTQIKTIESFNETQQSQIIAGMSKGITLKTQFYIKRGEVVCKTSEELPCVAHTFKVNLFWMGRFPMIYGKKYKIKINTNREIVYLDKILHIINASDLTTEENKTQIERYDVAQCVLKTLKPIVFDLYIKNQKTSRFVIVDEYDISGGGIILEPIKDEKSIVDKHVEQREFIWEKSIISPQMRASRFGQSPKFIVLTGTFSEKIDEIAKNLEKDLFDIGKNVYYLGSPKLLSGLESDFTTFDREEHIRRIGELARILTDTGIIFITTIVDLDDFESELLRSLNKPNEIIIFDLENILKAKDDIFILNTNYDVDTTLYKIKNILLNKNIIMEYYI